MKRIDSAANPVLKALRRLSDSSRERKKAGLTVLEGVHLVEAYCDKAGPPERIAVSHRGSRDPEIRALLARVRDAETLLLPDALFDALSTVATPSGVLAIVRTPRPQPVPQRMESCLMLEDLQDPGNLGSILRSCAAAGIGHVLLSRGSVHAWSPRVLRAGMGAHFALNIYEGANLEEAASRFDGRVVAAHPRATRTIFETDLTGQLALLLGNEGGGLSARLTRAAGAVAAIPMPGGTESLNVAAAAAVCLFERVRQMATRPGPRPAA